MREGGRRVPASTTETCEGEVGATGEETLDGEGDLRGGGRE